MGATQVSQCGGWMGLAKEIGALGKDHIGTGCRDVWSKVSDCEQEFRFPIWV